MTNGSLLENFYQVGKYVDRFNVSLHSLNSDVYSSIVGSNPDALSKVIKGIHKVVSKFPNAQIRFNATVLKGVNDDLDSISSILDFAQDVHASVKFIELYPSSTTGYVPLVDVENKLKELRFEKIQENARQSIYSRDNAVNAVVTRIFCAHAARNQDPNGYCRLNQDLFITPEGGIKTCMNTSEVVSISDAVKSRDLKRVSCQFASAINQMGRHCHQRKD